MAEEEVGMALLADSSGPKQTGRGGRRFLSSLRSIVKSDELPAMAGDFELLMSKHKKEYLEVKEFNEKKRRVLASARSIDSKEPEVENQLESLQQILQYLPPNVDSSPVDEAPSEEPLLKDVPLDFIQTAGMGKSKVSKKDKGKTKYYCDFYRNGLICQYKFVTPKKGALAKVFSSSSTTTTDASDESGIKVLDSVLHATFIQRIITAEDASRDESYVGGGGGGDAIDVHVAKVTGLFLSHLESIEATNSFKLFATEGVYVCSAETDELRSQVLATVTKELKQLFYDKVLSAEEYRAASLENADATDAKTAEDFLMSDTWRAKIDAARQLLPLEMEQFEIQMMRHEQIMKSLTMTGLASSDSGILGSVYKTKSGVMKLLVPQTEVDDDDDDDGGDAQTEEETTGDSTDEAVLKKKKKKKPRVGRWEDQFFVITDDTLYWFDHDPKKGAKKAASGGAVTTDASGKVTAMSSDGSGGSSGVDDDLLTDSKMPNSFMPLKYVSVAIDKRRVQKDKFVFEIRSPLRTVFLRCKHPIALAEWLAAVSACNPKNERSSWDYLMEIRSIRSKASSLLKLLKYPLGISYYRDYLRDHAEGGKDYTPLLRCFMALLHFKHKYEEFQSRDAADTGAVAVGGGHGIPGFEVGGTEAKSAAEEPEIIAVGQGPEDIWSDWDISSDEDEEEAERGAAPKKQADLLGIGDAVKTAAATASALEEPPSVSMISLIKEARVIYNEFLTAIRLPSKKERSTSTVDELEASGQLQSNLCIWKLPLLGDDVDGSRSEELEKLKRRFKKIFGKKKGAKRDSILHFSSVLSRDIFDDLSDLLLDDLKHHYSIFVTFDSGKLFAEMSDELDKADTYKVLSVTRDSAAELLTEGSHALWLVILPKAGDRREVELKFGKKSKKKKDATTEPPSVVQRVVTVGRDISNNIIVEDSHVSRSHGRIEYSLLPPTLVDSATGKDGHAYYCDLGSHHGSKLNGDKVIYEELRSGDTLTLGSCEIVFEIREPTAPKKGVISSLFGRVMGR